MEPFYQIKILIIVPVVTQDTEQREALAEILRQKVFLERSVTSLREVPHPTHCINSEHVPGPVCVQGLKGVFGTSDQFFSLQSDIE